jgi:hypothetical protein
MITVRTLRTLRIIRWTALGPIVLIGAGLAFLEVGSAMHVQRTGPTGVSSAPLEQ